MKNMRKMVSLVLTAAMTAGLMTGMGALTASADSERTKITALLKGTESTEQFQTFDYLLKNFCDEKGLDYEIELVNDMQDYFTKLQMYINSDTLPDIFGCPNGTLSAACKDIDALVDVGAELERNGYKNEPFYINRYVTNLTKSFNKFYNTNPIMKDDVDEETKKARLAIVDATTKVIKTALGLLGIETVESM